MYPLKKTVFITTTIFLLFLVGCGGESKPDSPPPTPVVSLSISPTTANVMVGESRTFTVTPQNTDFTLSAPSAAGCARSGNAVTCMPTAAGTYTVTVTSTADTSKSASATVAVTNTDTDRSEIIEQAYLTIKASADSILLSEDPIGGFTKIKPEYDKLDGVKNTSVSEDALYIVFENGAEFIWLINNITPDYHFESSSIQLSSSYVIKNEATTLNRKALLINQMFNDVRFHPVIDELQTLKNEFEKNGWQVTVKNGNEADVNFFKNGLSGYDVLFITTHGKTNITGNPFFVTGEEFSGGDWMGLWKAIVDSLDFSDEYAHLGATLKEVRIVDGQEVEVSVQYVGIKPQFIINSYSESSFSNSLVYNATCYGMGKIGGGNPNFAMAKAFVENGAKVYFGWKEPNSIGHISGRHLLSQLLLGKTIEETWQYLGDYTIDGGTLRYHGGAVLEYYPENSDINDFRLVEPPDVDDDDLSRTMIFDGALAHANDTNTYEIVAEKSGKWQIQFTAPYHSSGYLRFGITFGRYEPDPETIMNDFVISGISPLGINYSTSEMFLQNGTYYIKVSGNFNYVNIPYTLVVNYEVDDGQYEDEPNNSLTTATIITPGQPKTGSILNSDDEDWFKFETEKSGKISFSFTAPYPYLPGYLRFGITFGRLEPDPETIMNDVVVSGISPGGVNYSTSEMFLHKGTYYIKVAGNFNYENIPYTLVVNYEEDEI